jgi:glycosyltransferase involved in cell wall biosynthesis
VRSSYRAARRARGLVVVAEALQERLLAHLDRAWIRLIPCGIDLERFAPRDQAASRRQLGWPDDRVHVLFNAGGDDPVKRPALARAAVEQLNSTGVPATMHEMRGVRNDEVAVWLSASDALLLTSLHEGSPTIVKEALACNLAVVSVDVGDVRERIKGIDGCHLAAAEPAALAEALRLVSGRTARVNGREKMMELSLESTAARLAAFYDEIMRTSIAAAPAAARRCDLHPRDHASASH